MNGLNGLNFPYEQILYRRFRYAGNSFRLFRLFLRDSDVHNEPGSDNATIRSVDLSERQKPDRSNPGAKAARRRGKPGGGWYKEFPVTPLTIVGCVTT